MRTTTGNLYFEIFGVKERLHCVWDCNMPALNSEFLNSVDHDYFHYLGEIHASALAGPNKLRAAIALHTAYYHGLETLFSLIFAGLHTWKAVPAWILKCPTEELRKLVADVQLNQQSPNAQMHFEEYSWKSISALFNGVALRGNKENERIAEDIGKLWEMFAEDFIDGFIVEAYNSFKHGFRVKLGGVKISFKAAAKPEDATLATNFQELTNSEFGASFYVTNSIKDAPNQKPDRHVRIGDRHINCYPQYTIEALRLISISIFNVVLCLKKLNGEEESQGLIPGGDDWFSELVRKRSGLMNFDMVTEISERDIKRFGSEEMQQFLNAKKADIKITYSSPMPMSNESKMDESQALT